MKSFKLFYEDFNNWRNTSGAIETGKNTTWSGNEPAGFKGAEGLGRDGAVTQVNLKSPKGKLPIDRQELRTRKRRQKRDVAAYKQEQQTRRILKDN